MHWKFRIENQPIDDDVRDSVSFANFVNTTYLGTYLLNSLVSYLKLLGLSRRVEMHLSKLKSES